MSQIHAKRHSSQSQYPRNHAPNPARFIHDQLDWPGNVVEGQVGTMHWRNCEHLYAKHDTFEDVVSRSSISRFGPMLKKGGVDAYEVGKK
jgi:hypothetical protein